MEHCRAWAPDRKQELVGEIIGTRRDSSDRLEAANWQILVDFGEMDQHGGRGTETLPLSQIMITCCTLRVYPKET